MLKNTIYLYLMILFISPEATAGEVYFNIGALELSDAQKRSMDTSRISNVNDKLPGEYLVKVIVNDEFKFTKRVNFEICGNDICPVFDYEFIKAIGVDVSSVSVDHKEVYFKDIRNLLKGAETEINTGYDILKITIPQVYLASQVSEENSPENWGAGLPMVFSNYDLFADKNRTKTEENSESFFLNTRNGFNAGEWRFRNYTYVNKSYGTTSIISPRSWVERDVKDLRARLLLGETSSSGYVFDSIGLKGVNLTSKDEMLPYNKQGYAPEIRGVAQTNALVEIYQENNLLYKTKVSPGNFVIKDLFQTISSGDLTVKVIEENGSIHKFTQAYASPPVSVRKGMSKYSFSLGGTGGDKSLSSFSDPFLLSEYIYGLTAETSVYGGVFISDYYNSQVVGIGQSLGAVGAVSVDLTNASTKLNKGQHADGRAWQLKYSKKFESTNTFLLLSGYKYATDGFYSLSDAVNNRNVNFHPLPLKSIYQVTLSQPLSYMGSLYFTLFEKNYWSDDASKNLSSSLGWNNTISGVGISVNVSQDKLIANQNANKQLSFTVDVPLNMIFGGRSGNSVYTSQSYSADNLGNTSLTTNLYGSALDNNRLNWNISRTQNNSSHFSTKTNGISASYAANNVLSGINYSYRERDGQSLGLSFRGAAVLHPYGLTFSRPLSEGAAYALVRAENAQGVQVLNSDGIYTDGNGLAVITSLTPYRGNEVNVSNFSSENNINVVDTSQKLIPETESLLLADFKVKKGSRVYAKILHENKPLSFGTSVKSKDAFGIVDESGFVYLTGVEDKQIITAQLGNGFVCNTSFVKSESQLRNGIAFSTLNCQ